MGTQVSSVGAALLTSLVALLFGFSSILCQELRERDALCNPEGCFVVYFQRKTFLDSWRACKERGGNLAVIKRRKDAANIAALFSGLDLPHSRPEVRVWIGLQRQPRQCSAARPLRGFSWTTGDQDTEYTNWQKEDSPGMCSVSRCVVMGYGTQEQADNFKWLDGSCSVPVDGYLCYYAYKGMCPTLENEGAGNALYTTPFNLISSLLTHVPFGSVAVLPCPQDTEEEQSALCTVRDDGSVGWSKETPLCSDPSVSLNPCDQNGGCEHFCRPAGSRFYCECAQGYQLGGDEKSCKPYEVCEEAPCEFECLPLQDSYRCVCPEGYMLAQDERDCLDVDECTQSPCEHLCVNTEGSFECQCWEGYQRDDKGDCEDVDECMNNPCEHHCENTEGSYICHCSLGFSAVPEDPSRCQDIDECRYHWTCEQMCENHVGGFQCYCEEGYDLLADQSSCQNREETGSQSGVTHQPRYVWDSLEDSWGTTVEDQTLYWQPEQDISDVIPVANTPTAAHADEGDSSTKMTPTATYARSTPGTTSDAFSEWYEDGGEEATTPLPFLSTSTLSEGAGNWWGRLTSPETDEAVHVGDFTEKADVETEHAPRAASASASASSTSASASTFTQFAASPPPRSVRNVTGVDADPPKRGNTWLLVGLLVPICVFIVVMVALGIVYCARCAVRSRNASAPDCYHWISGAQDKQGAPNPSAGVKARV